MIYGRRRVGKTFLMDESLDGEITFRHAGLSPVETEAAMVSYYMSNWKWEVILGLFNSFMPYSWFFETIC